MNDYDEFSDEPSWYDNDGPEPEDEPLDDMDGDAQSALASAGWGTDEDYGGYNISID